MPSQPPPHEKQADIEQLVIEIREAVDAEIGAQQMPAALQFHVDAAVRADAKAAAEVQAVHAHLVAAEAHHHT